MPAHVTRFNSFRDLSSFSAVFITESLINCIHFTQPLQDSYWRPYPHSSLSVQTLPYLPAFGFSYFLSVNICFKRFLINVATEVWPSLWMNVLFIWEKSDCKISFAIHFSVLMLLLTGMTSGFLIMLVFKSNKQRTVPPQLTSLSSELVSCLSSSAKSDFSQSVLSLSLSLIH